jgi:hypothetical protein
MGSNPRTLVAIIGETRATELTAESFRTNVLDALGADLALCVKAGEPENPLHEWARYRWTFDEPRDWARQYDEMAGGAEWRALLGFSHHFLDALSAPDQEDPSGEKRPSSDPILHFYRRILRFSLEREGLLESYDWLVLTRSDFLWPRPHPHPRHLSPRHVYTLDGERYGGVCDRHFVCPRRDFSRFLSVSEPIFAEPVELRRRIERISARQGWFFLNSERFLAMRLRELGLWGRLRYLPYVPYTVRAPGGPTNWSTGVFDQHRGYYVKYPAELEASEIAQDFIVDQVSWQHYLSPVRGAALRHRLKGAYRRRGLYERTFRRRDPILRGTGRLREASIRIGEASILMARRGGASLDRAAGRLGRHLRKIPGIPRLLDARRRRISRQVANRPVGARLPTAGEEARATFRPSPGTEVARSMPDPPDR